MEERVLVLIGEFRRLKDENQELSRQIDQLNREKETLVEEQNLSQACKRSPFQIGILRQKKRKGSQVMRTKVKTLLENLEKFDLA